MRRIYIADEPSRAHLVKGVLEAEGIPAEVRGDQPFWADGSMVPRDMRPEIWVRDEDGDRAVALLAAIEERIRHGGKWRCEACGLDHTGSFDACWKCGGARPD